MTLTYRRFIRIASASSSGEDPSFVSSSPLAATRQPRDERGRARRPPARVETRGATRGGAIHDAACMGVTHARASPRPLSDSVLLSPDRGTNTILPNIDTTTRARSRYYTTNKTGRLLEEPAPVTLPVRRLGDSRRRRFFSRARRRKHRRRRSANRLDVPRAFRERLRFQARKL